MDELSWLLAEHAVDIIYAADRVTEDFAKHAQIKFVKIKSGDRPEVDLCFNGQ